MGQKYSDETYLSINPFEGDMDVDIRMHAVKIVKTRKTHKCIFPENNEAHEIPIGSKAWRESAVIDNKFSSCYVCLDCLDKWIDFLEDNESGRKNDD